MAQSKESQKDRSARRVLMYAQTAEDVSIIQDILAGIGGEGVACTDLGDLCRRTAQDVDAVLLTEQSIVDGALLVLAEAMESQPDWSDLPVLFVAAGGAESPLAVQAMQELRNVVILDRPVRIATLASVLRMASRVRDKQRQVRDLLQEREQREQRLRQLTRRLEGEVEAKTDSLTDTIDRLHDEVAGRALAEGELQKSSQMLVTEREKAFVELQERAHQLQQLTLELSQTEDRERKRLAEILHDDLQQLLAAARFQIGLLGNRAKGDGELLEMVGQIKAILVEAIEKSRSLSHELSPPGLAHNDMGEALGWLTQQMWRKHGLIVRLDIRGRIELQSEPLKTLLYKAAQEMLFNVVKHAGVTKARLRLRRWGGSICLSVSDKGQGFDPQGPGHTGGFGLLSIRERVKLLGGRMKVRSAKGRGSTFLIVVPDSQPPICSRPHHPKSSLSRSAHRRPTWATETRLLVPALNFQAPATR
jgi:signal transduction histidine kinase